MSHFGSGVLIPAALPCLQLFLGNLQWPLAYFLSSRAPAPRVAPPPPPPQLNSVRVSPVSPYRLILLAAFALGVGREGEGSVFPGILV